MTNKSSAVLVVGTGSIGERHLRCFQATGRCTVSACEPNAELRHKVSHQYGCDSFASLEEALAAQRWDAVVLCTPANFHVPMAIQCAELGIDLLIEKPLATSLDGVDALTEAAKKVNVIRVAYVHRSISALMRAQELIASGVIGAVKHVVGVAGANFPEFRPAYVSTYYAKRATGGGCIQDALTHMVHAVEWMVAPFEKVYCDASHQVLAGVDVEDTVNLSGRLRGDIPVALIQNQFQVPYELSVSIHGVSGSIRAELHRERVGIIRSGEKEWSWTQLPQEERDAMFIRQANAFLDAMEGKPDTLATLAEGIQTLKVNLAALASADSGVVVKL